jgi:hypothetical protein
MLVSQSYHALSFLRLLSPRADNPIEAGWVNPQPGADFTQTWFKGDTLSISWEGWPSSSIDKFLTTNVANLWITSFYDDHSPFTLLLTSKSFTNPSLPWLLLLVRTSFQLTHVVFVVYSQC